MKVLWLCNVALPMIAGQFGLESSNKEGWLSGLAHALLEGRRENDIRLSVAFPMPGKGGGKNQEICAKEVQTPKGALIDCYGFCEDVANAEVYDMALQARMRKIIEMAKPDIVHCFGTEYAHTLAMCRVFPKKERILVGIQGICTLYAESYFADLPGEVLDSVTFRDRVRKDTLRRQQEKFAIRGEREREALGLAGNITGRTEWDRAFGEECNPHARYYPMNETLRREFYGPVWEEGGCIPHSVFVSQGDYPLKGLHYMLLAMPAILAGYPDAKVFVAGNSLVEYGTWKQKLKISAYGKYLRRLLDQNGLHDKVVFLGRLDAGQMLDRYLQSSLYVCCSALENSPNSLGEAMLLGMPCVSADVGGISSIFTDGRDGILYKGFSAQGVDGARAAGCEGETFRRGRPQDRGQEASGRGQAEACGLEAVAGRLADAVVEMWENPEKRREYCANARKHAMETHHQDRNYHRLLEVYRDMA